MTAIELGDLDRGYHEISLQGDDKTLYSLTCPLMLGTIIVAIPKHTKGALAIAPKKADGQPLTSRVDALEAPTRSGGYLLPPPGVVDPGSLATGTGDAGVREIKEWQAIMDHLRRLPVTTPGELPTIPVDEQAAEVRAIKIA